MKRVFTNSEMQTFKDCRRKWWLGWYRRLRPSPETQKLVSAAELGTTVHKALATHYSPTDTRDPLEVVSELTEEAMAAVQSRGGSEADVDEASNQGELAYIIMEGYLDWLEETGADQGLEVIAEEQVVRVPLPGFDDVDLAGRLDLRVTRELDGARLFVDHKTVGQFSQMTKTLHLDEQMLLYTVLEALQDERIVDGGIYNMLRKVKRTERAQPPFYKREEVRHNPRVLKSFWQRLWGTVWDILRVEKMLDEGADPLVVAYPRPSKDCSWKCEFFDVCYNLDDIPEAAEQMLGSMFTAADPLDRYKDEVTNDDAA